MSKIRSFKGIHATHTYGIAKSETGLLKKGVVISTWGLINMYLVFQLRIYGSIQMAERLRFVAG